jgi:hypothetical protein
MPPWFLMAFGFSYGMKLFWFCPLEFCMLYLLGWLKPWNMVLFWGLMTVWLAGLGEALLFGVVTVSFSK